MEIDEQITKKSPGAQRSGAAPLLGALIERKNMDDKKRIDWLEKQQGSALVSDDHSHWVVATFGMQNIPKKFPGDINTSFFIKKKEWKKSIREAIDFAMKRDI